MGILELDDVISEINMRDIPKIARNYANLKKSERYERIYVLNKEIRRVESNSNYLSKINLLGYALPPTLELMGVQGAAYYSLAGFLLNALPLYAKKRFMNNKIYQSISAAPHRVSRDTIIIRNVRNAVSRIK
ncbi:hypothetical protein BZG78_04355 [Salinivibrio sp. MA351]|nr:hypothetical protein BZG78_04355 [Salinivibrio sp. MA351]